MTGYQIFTAANPYHGDYAKRFDNVLVNSVVWHINFMPENKSGTLSGPRDIVANDIGSGITERQILDGILIRTKARK